MRVIKHSFSFVHLASQMADQVETKNHTTHPTALFKGLLRGDPGHVPSWSCSHLQPLERSSRAVAEECSASQRCALHIHGGGREGGCS